MTVERDGAEPAGTWLRWERESAGLSQEELAERSGVSVRTISDLERGRTRAPHPRSVRLLAGALRLPAVAGDELVARYRAGRAGGETEFVELIQEESTAVKPSRGTGRESAGGDRLVVPRELPAALGGFVGRSDELKALTGMLDGAVGEGALVISAIGGTAGIGKTALAVHWAHQVAAQFPDGQLYVDLRGFGPSGMPAAPAAVIRGFLDSFGVLAGRVPASLESQAGLYRSLVAGKRVLFVLDNARNEQQVRPLLPGSPGCLVVVTSRTRLAGLVAAEGARLVTVDVLSEDEAREFLAGRLGAERVAGELAAAGELTGLCARLPLALAVAAAWAAARPGFPLATLVAELKEAAGRLDALATGDAVTSVRAVFSWSCRQLGPAAARMFRLLGEHPGPDITIAAAASLTGAAPGQAREAVAELTRAHLLAEHSPGRYACHDLLRAYAAECARAEEDEAGRRSAVHRVLDHYLHTAHTAALLLKPSREPVTLTPPLPGVTPEHLAGHRQALAWFDAEHHILLAAAALAAGSRFDIHAWQIPWAMADFLERRGLWRDSAALQRSGLTAATRLGDTAGQATASRCLGTACAWLTDYDQARAHMTDSLKLSRQLGDQGGEARAYQILSWVADRQGRYADALRHAEQALALFRAVGHRPGQADALNAVGWCHALLGNGREACAFCRQALALHRELGNRRGEANTWDSLGYAEHQLGNLAEATLCYRNALGLFRELGDRFNEAEILTHLGDTRQAVGDPPQAQDAWQQGLDILADLHHPDADRLRARLRDLEAAT